ncbi:MAG: TonB-dependent receptor [Candidatus Omnitrophota bacterium]
MRVVIAVLLVVLSVTGSYSSAIADEKKNEKKRITDVITAPVKAILSPVSQEGLADIVLFPVDKVLSPVFDIGEIVVTPGRTPEYVYNVNTNISVINSDDIRKYDFRDTQQLLGMDAGIVVSGFMNNPKDNNIDMRGFGEAGLLNYVVLIDGRRTNQIDMSGPDLSQIDINTIEKVEIIKGANSVLYGDNATGGVVNIITKRGKKGDHVEYRQEFGSFHYHKEYVSINGGHDFIDYFFSYSYQDSDGFRVNNDYEADDIFTSFVLRPVEFMDIDVSSGYHRDWYGMPGALFPANIRSDGTEGTRFPDSKAKTEDYYVMVDPRILFEKNDHEGVLSSFISYRARRSNSLSVGFNRYENNHHLESLDFRPKAEIYSSLFNDSMENKLVLGIDYFYAKDQVLSGDITFRKSQVDIIKETLAVYASDNLMINKRFILNGGIRGEWAEYIFDQHEPVDTYDTRSLKEAAFDAGAGYKYNERSQIYINYARSYRYPATDEFFQSAYESFDWFTWSVMVFPAVLNAGLKQQTGNNYEIGIKDNSFDLLSINASYYLIENKNEIYYDPIDYENRNYPRTIHHGFELQTKTEISEKVTLFFNYNFQKAFFAGGKFASKSIPLVPEQKISCGVNLSPVEKFDIFFIVNHLGDRYIMSDQKNEVSKLKPHTTMDLGCSFEYKNIRVFGTIRNIFGERYFSNAIKNFLGNPAFYPAPGRTFEGGVAIKF